MRQLRRRGRRDRGNPRLVKVLAMLLVPLVVFFIAACDSDGSGSQTPRTPYQGSPEGVPPGLSSPIPDPTQVSETTPASQLPTFLNTSTGPAHDRLLKLYKGAVDHYQAYSHIPCYCGCALYTTAHMSLAQCYVSSLNAGGTVVFTDHSTSCDICQGIAQATLDGIAASTPLKDIRAGILKQFKYTGIWTDTPTVP